MSGNQVTHRMYGHLATIPIDMPNPPIDANVCVAVILFRRTDTCGMWLSEEVWLCAHICFCTLYSTFIHRKKVRI